MNAYAKAVQLNALLSLKERLEQLVDPDPKLIAQVDDRIALLGERKEDVDPETGEVR